MKAEWTKRRTKIDSWQRNSSAGIMKIDLDAIRSEFELERERLGKTLAKVSSAVIVFCDDLSQSHLEDTLLTSAQWRYLIY
jgi:hypothetical protein